MPINQKMLDIRQRIKVEKTGWNEKHEFAYFKESDVLTAARDEMNRVGVIPRTRVIRYEHNAFYDNNGRYRPRANADVEVAFIDVEDGTEFVTVVAAEGSGTGDDVSSRKLATQARKIAYLTAFDITEDNDRFDGDASEDQEPVNNSAPVEEPEVGPSLADLTAKIGKYVGGWEDEDGKHEALVTGSQVNALGTKFAKELNVSETPRVWRKDITVLAKVAESIEKGEVE